MNGWTDSKGSEQMLYLEETIKQGFGLLWDYVSMMS